MDSIQAPGQFVQSSKAEPVESNKLFDVQRCSKATVALVDELTLSRDCLMSSLNESFDDEIVVESFASIEAMISSEISRFALVLLYIHNRSVDKLPKSIDLIASIPIPVMLIIDDKADLRLYFENVLRVRICGVVFTADSDCKLLSASVRFALSGGTFFPPLLIMQESAASIEALSSKKARGKLTARQVEVFAKLQQGKPNKVIAYELGMSESTTKIHIRNLMRNIGATNRTEAVFIGQKCLASNVMQKVFLDEISD